MTKKVGRHSFWISQAKGSTKSQVGIVPLGMSTPDSGDKSGSGAGTAKMQSSTGSSAGSGGAGGAGGNAGGSLSGSGGSGGPATAYPIDLASASKVLVRPTEKTNMPTTYR